MTWHHNSNPSTRRRHASRFRKRNSPGKLRRGGMAGGRAWWRDVSEGDGGAAAQARPPRDGLPVSIFLCWCWFVFLTRKLFLHLLTGMLWETKARGTGRLVGGRGAKEPTGNAIQIWSQNPSGWVHTTCFSCFAIRRSMGLEMWTDGAHVGNFVCQGPEAARRHSKSRHDFDGW